jgi:hypothetical protein
VNNESNATSLFTAFPHDRGIFNGLIVDRSGNQTQPKQVQCFSTWASNASFKGFFSLATTTAAAKDSGDQQLRLGDDDSDEDDSDAESGDEDDENGGAGNDQDDDDDNDDVEVSTLQALSSKKKKSGKRRGRAGYNPNGNQKKKKNHYAFKRLPEKLNEAWFVLSPANVNEGTSQVTSYDLLPLMEVFSCQKKAYDEANKHVGDDKKAPKLFEAPKISQAKKK